MGVSESIDESVHPRADDHVRGKLGAPVFLLEYGDFQCPTCRQAATAVDLLMDRFGEQVQFAFRHFPLENMHPDALAAAEAAECAAAQNSFWSMHRLLFENQHRLKPADLESYAIRLKLDRERYTADLNGHVFLPNVRRDIELGKQARLRATPGFLINGRALDVSFGMRSLHDAVERAVREEYGSS